MKQILWFAQKNSYDLVYLTAFKDQAVLIRVLEYFGFKTTGPISLDEQIYEKALPRGLLIPDAGADLFDLARTNYPRFVGRPPANAYCVPIKGEYHDVLFPELAIRIQGDLFQSLAVSGSDHAARTPGNTIRKVYLCRAPIKGLTPGSVLPVPRCVTPWALRCSPGCSA